MRIGAVICELNPFHNGHKYIFDRMRKDGCEYIVAVMSSSFTQRGDVAIHSKFERTKKALYGGADLVIELPVVWSVASAQRFARGACEIIKALGCVDTVCFGCESDDPELVKKAAAATRDYQVTAKVRELMSGGAYYPSALDSALRELYGDKIADITSSPNNVLAIEYLKELEDCGIDTVMYTRIGAEHDSDAPSGSYASASLLRSMILSDEDITGFVPDDSDYPDNPASFKYGERAFIYKLRSMSASEFECLPDVSEGLENRILDAIKEYGELDSILMAIKTKRYTHARLRRILTCALLGITANIQQSPVPYIRILGFKSSSSDLLSLIKTKAHLPVIINVAQDIQCLSDDAKEIFNIEMKATDIRTVFEKKPEQCHMDLTNGIIKI